MNKLTYVRELKLSERQLLKVPLVDQGPAFDLNCLVGEDFNTFCAKTENAVWSTLRRTPRQNFPTVADTTGLTHFAFYSVLPLERLSDVLIKHEMTSSGFELLVDQFST